MGVALLTIASLIAYALFATRPEPATSASESPPRIVEVVRATPVPVARTYRGYATARALSKAIISAQVQGLVTERPPGIEEGVPVTQGQVLLRIDDTDYLARAEATRQSIASLEAQLRSLDAEAVRLSRRVEQIDQEVALAEEELDRLIQAFERGGSSDIEIIRLRSSVIARKRSREQLLEQQDQIPTRRASISAEIKRARAQLTVDEKDIERTTIRSPLTGVIETISVEQGELLRIGQEIARVVDLRTIEIPLRIPAAAAGRITPGDTVDVSLEGEGRRSWQARVARTGPTADARSRTVTVYLELEQDPAAADPLLPGRFVTAEVAVGEPRSRILVPRRAVSDDRVYVVEPVSRPDGSTVRRLIARPVTVEFHLDGTFESLARPAYDQWSVVVAGLEPGDLVVTNNSPDLSEGARVDPVPATEPPTRAGDRAPAGETSGVGVGNNRDLGDSGVGGGGGGAGA